MDTEIDAKTFWKAIGCRAIGVAVVTARGSDGPAGFLALSATHLCASPPMMMVSIGLTTSALGAVRQSSHFAINYVPKGADALVKEFAGQGSLKGADRFLPGAWGTLKTDRAPWHGHRAGPRRGLQRLDAGPTDQLPRRLSMKLAAHQNTWDRMQPNRARRPFMDVTRGASDDLPGPCSGHHGPSCATGGV